ncbi:unnamed protein product [Lymnaea stagnalis]|uniref:Uncharacterized protein n=1 Tax=Lymnaea stagnalis TaxID=6523 RepID=A0AAV2IMN1_LYMST
MSGAWTKRVMDFLQKTKDGRQSDAMMSERLSLTSQQRAVSLGGETHAAIEAFKARQGSRRSDFSESERKAQKNGSLDEKANEQKRRSYGEKTNEQTRRSFDEKTHEQRGRSYGERAIEKREVSQGSSAHTSK